MVYSTMDEKERQDRALTDAYEAGKAQPQHTDDCESWGCAHCTVCGVGVLYGSRCHAHPATNPCWCGE